MRRITFITCLAFGLVALALPATGLASQPVDNEHTSFTSTQPDNWCGIDGTSVTTGAEQYREDAAGAFIDNLSYRSIFTAAASGKSMIVQQASTSKGYWVNNPDGSSTLVATTSGIGPKFMLPTGQVIIDTGTSGYEVFFDADGNFTGFTFLYHHGPLPAACDAIVAALG